jgi:hypothetical protein
MKGSGYALLLLLICGLSGCSDGGNKSAPAAAAPPPAASSVAASANPAASSQESLEARQTAYKAWRSDFDVKIKQYDSLWKTWRAVFARVGDPSGNIYSTYSGLKALADRMDSFKGSLEEIKAPETLSEDQRKDLNEARAGLSLSTEKRMEAVHKAMEMFDSQDFRPSAIEGIKSTIDEGDAFLLLAWAKVFDVETQLGLMNNKGKQPGKSKKHQDV